MDMMKQDMKVRLSGWQTASKWFANPFSFIFLFGKKLLDKYVHPDNDEALSEVAWSRPTDRFVMATSEIHSS